MSDRAFAKARAHLYMPALTALSDMLVQRAEQAGLVPRWHGLRVVAADGSVLMPAVRACKRTKSLASADQRLFALYLPAAELTLHASVYDPTGSERQMLVESLDRLGPQDLLVLDRGYPAAWLVALLDERGIRWCMRCDNDSGWKALRGFARSGADDAWVSLNPPSAEDVQTWGCGRAAPRVRLVRCVSTTGAVRVLATNLDAQGYPAEAFGDLYHQRWRIEEAFKRLKMRSWRRGIKEMDLILGPWADERVERLDPETLETLGHESFGSTIDAPYLAHTRVDHPRGRLVGLSPRPGARATALTFTEHDGAGKLVCRREASIPEFTIIHDFAITERFYVVFAAAMRPDPKAFLRAKFGLGTMIDAVGLDRARASTVYLVPREGGGPALPISLGRSLFAIHHASAHDLVGPDGRPIAVVFDSCCLEEFEFGREFGYRGTDRRLDPGIARGPAGQLLTRLRLDIEGRRAKAAPLSPYCVDFPRVHPTRDGYGCRYVYGATTDVPGVSFPFNAILRVDCARAEAESDLAAASTLWAPGDGRLCGEPVFVPDPEGDDEAAGWVLVMIYDGDADAATTVLCVLDAQRLDAGPIASVDLDLLLPYGFHGNWAPAKA